MFVEIERIAALYAEKLAVDSGAVAIVRADDVAVTDAQCGFTSVRAVGADRAHMLHFPRPRLIRVRSARQCTDGADVDARTALIAFQMIAAVWNDFRRGPAISHTERA